MVLKEVIEALENEDAALVVPKGFNSPHSYRGDYSELAFEPAENVTVGKMLQCAREALGTTYKGYKGGDFKMDEWTSCNIAEYGHCGEELGGRLLRFMLDDARRKAKESQATDA